MCLPAAGAGDEDVAAERLGRAHVENVDVGAADEGVRVGVGIGGGQSGGDPQPCQRIRVRVGDGHHADEVAQLLPRRQVHPRGDVSTPDDADAQDTI